MEDDVITDRDDRLSYDICDVSPCGSNFASRKPMDRPSESFCACKLLREKATVIDAGIYAQCEGVDDVCGVRRNCLSSSAFAFSHRLSEKYYCHVHADLISAHRLCLHCFLFCAQGDVGSFVVCEAVHGEQHWSHECCAKRAHGTCSHCESHALRCFRQLPALLPVHNRMLQRFSRLTDEYNTGIHLNLLCLLEDRLQSVVLDEMDHLNDWCSLRDGTLSDTVEKGHLRALLHNVWRNAAESEEEKKMVLSALKKALMHRNSTALLLILQFIEVKLDSDVSILAVSANDPLITKVLLHHGASLTLMEKSGVVTDLFSYACCRNSFVVAEEVLKYFGWRRTPLAADGERLVYKMVARGCVRAVQLLVQYGANVLLHDATSGSPFHVAVAHESHALAVEMICALLPGLPPRCASLELKDANGRTALEIAWKKENWDAVILLLKNGAFPKEVISEMKPPEVVRSLVERLSKELRLRKLISLSRTFLVEDVTKGLERCPIPLENRTSDGAIVDAEFEYVNTVSNIDLYRSKIDFSLACRCVNECTSGCECSTGLYSAEGRLTDKGIQLALSSELGIIPECNSSCFCSTRCPSRVAQKGVSTRLEIYRSRNCGWAVRSAQFIPKGEFICEYTGELISEDEANRRDDDTYLFEVHGDSTLYCIDAKVCGNVSRFVNHSCDANLVVARVVWDANIRRFPHVCFFAKRSIAKGEQLTIDYGKQWWDVKLEKILCECGSKVCRYRESAREKLLLAKDSVDIVDAADS